MKDEIYTSLGKLVVNYTRLEFYLSVLFNTLKNTNKGGLTFLKEEGVFKTTTKIKSYSSEKIKNKDYHNQLCILMDELNHVREKRNNLLHSIFYYSEEQNETFQFDTLKNIKDKTNSTNTITINEIDQVSKDIKGISAQLTILILNLTSILKEEKLLQP